jgi:hypothetical protein
MAELSFITTMALMKVFSMEVSFCSATAKEGL